MASIRKYPSDSKNAVNVIIDVVAKNAPPRPIDPNDPLYPHLLEMKRRRDAAKKTKKRRDDGEGSGLQRK